MRIYVGNMPYQMTDLHLRELFEPFGQVSAINIITDRETGRPRGFGFVEMASETEGRKAVEALQTHTAEGRPLNINEAKPREPRRGGTGMGGRERW
ncbi:MAG: RNA-binding protein [Myxococcota bacterium]|nr:RNA-binding protein [Myxococcota bacterium]